MTKSIKLDPKKLLGKTGNGSKMAGTTKPVGAKRAEPAGKC
jgi:hypothetical protein